VLKKTSAYTGLVIVTAAGALLASSPAHALDGLVRGSWSSHHHRSHHKNRNWNGNHHRGRIFIRIYIYNKNNNQAVAIAKPERWRHRRDFVPNDGVTGGGAVAGRTPARSFRDSAPVEPARSFRDSAPVEPAPATTTADGGTANNAPSTTEAPATSGAAAPAMDENATG
jgi:hypothetical protein